MPAATDANLAPPFCPECAAIWPAGAAACGDCGYDLAAARELAIIQPPASARQVRRERLILLWSLVAVAVFWALILLFDDDREVLPWLALVAVGAVGVGFLAHLLTGGRRNRWRRQLRLRESGYAQRLLLGPVKPAKWKDWPDLPVVRFESGTGTLKGVLLGAREATPKVYRVFGQAFGSTNQPNAWKAMVDVPLSPRAHRIVAAARALAGDRKQPASERVGRVSHCPACLYRLAGLSADDERDDAPTRCPECGWAWAPGDVVLYGRRGPSFAGNIGPRGILALLAAIVGGGLAGFVVGALPIFLMIWAWRNLPPGWSHASLAVGLMFVVGGLAWLVAKSARWGEAARQKADRLGDAADAPAGLMCLRLSRAGLHQALLGEPDAEPIAWNDLDPPRIQRWPGGVRVRADKRGKPRRWWRPNRPVDFVCDLADPADVNRLRRLVKSRSLERRASSPARPASAAVPTRLARRGG